MRFNLKIKRNMCNVRDGLSRHVFPGAVPFHARLATHDLELRDITFLLVNVTAM